MTLYTLDNGHIDQQYCLSKRFKIGAKTCCENIKNFFDWTCWLSRSEEPLDRRIYLILGLIELVPDCFFGFKSKVIIVDLNSIFDIVNFNNEIVKG